MMFRANNIELTNALRTGEGPALPAVLETLTWPAWAVVTRDEGLREQVAQGMADWEEAMRLLRRPVTEPMRRQERFRRWEEVAVQYQDPELGAAAVAEGRQGVRPRQRSTTHTFPTEVKGLSHDPARKP